MTTPETLALIDVLADGLRHSGVDLARQFGVSRAAMAKRIEKLRELGLEVSAQAGQGYQIDEPFQRLNAATLFAQLSPFAKGLAPKLAVLTHTDSTNSRLIASPRAHDPQLLFAEFQTAGRGRRGRSWQAPFASNIMMSVSTCFDPWPPRLTTLPLALAVASVRALSHCGVADVGIKWPNDLQLQGRKLAGILVEPRGETGGECRVVAGIGLNFSVPEAQLAALSQPAVSLLNHLLARSRHAPTRAELAVALASEWLQALNSFASTGFASFAAEWRAHDVLLGERLGVMEQPELVGTGAGINADGALLLDTGQGMQALHAGEVKVCRLP